MTQKHWQGSFATVDPIELRKKLQRMGIGPGLPLSLEFSLDAVRESVFARDPERPRNPAHPLELEELAYCLHAFAMQWEVPA